MYFSGLVTHLRDILACQALGFVFQPIFDLRRREVLGYKTLMRGPADSPLHTPEQLLRVARDAGLGLPWSASPRAGPWPPLLPPGCPDGSSST
jgi:EAL domain-containing protein (putative c-di-GMP-specific phosphodiesterase class I)